MSSLVRAGVESRFMAANSPHLVFDEVQRRSPIPLVSIVRASYNGWTGEPKDKRKAIPLSISRLLMMTCG